MRRASPTANWASCRRTRSTLIVRAAQEVVDGKLDAEFPLVVFQTGSGTQSNMNANEVIANRAIELAGGVVGSKKPIHPNDDVNRSQSSNDTFPAVMHIATRRAISSTALLPALARLRDDARRKGAGVCRCRHDRPHAFAGCDAGHAGPGDFGLGRATRRCARRNRVARRALDASSWRSAAPRSAPGSTRHPQFGETSPRQIARETGMPFVSGAEQVRGLVGARRDGQRERRIAHAGRRADEDRQRRALVRERAARRDSAKSRSPTTSPGSSIMPGKINPTQCEALTMVAVQVFGNDHAVAFAGSQGNFQLNVYKPVMLQDVLESIELLARRHAPRSPSAARRASSPTCRAFARNVERSLMLVTALNPHIGYENAAEDRADCASRRPEPAGSRAAPETGHGRRLRQLGRSGRDDASGQRLNRSTGDAPGFSRSRAFDDPGNKRAARAAAHRY